MSMGDLDFNIKREALYEIIADKIEVMILNDSYSLTQKLPSEQYLADSFDVSRPVIREALRILKERGLISSRQGAPSVITSPDARNLGDSLNRIVQLKNVSSSNVYQIRVVLETLSARLAAENRTESDLIAINAANAALSEKTVNAEKNAMLDLAYHKSIAHASKNPLLEMLIEAVSIPLEPIIEKIILSSNFESDAAQYHDKITAAISEKNGDLAVDRMRAHLMTSIRNYEVLLKKEED